MFRFFSYVALLLVIMSPAPHLYAQKISDAEALAAIKAGESKKFGDLVSNCVAGAGFAENMAAGVAGGIQRTGSFDVTLSANAGRIAYLAADAKRLYKPFTLTDIPDELRQPAVIVLVEPMKPTTSQNTVNVPAVIDHVVLKSKAVAEVVIQPTKVDTEPVTWSNLLGGKVDGNRAIAWFDYNAVRELPPGDFDMVVITGAGERRCKVGGKDRIKLFGPQR